MKYVQDALRNLAETNYANDNLNYAEAKAKDITNLFMRQYHYWLDHGTKVSMNANGKTSDGKSTFMA